MRKTNEEIIRDIALKQFNLIEDYHEIINCDIILKNIEIRKTNFMIFNGICFGIIWTVLMINVVY